MLCVNYWSQTLRKFLRVREKELKNGHIIRNGEIGNWKDIGDQQQAQYLKLLARDLIPTQPSSTLVLLSNSLLCPEAMS